MPNWKKVVVSGSDAVLNSVTASFTGSLTGALIGTASWATSALTASKILNVRATNDADYYLTAVDSLNGTTTEELLYSPTQITFNPQRGSLSTVSVTASFTGSLTGALIGTASWATNALTASFLPVGTYNITSSWAVSASQALTASRATSASYALTA